MHMTPDQSRWLSAHRSHRWKRALLASTALAVLAVLTGLAAARCRIDVLEVCIGLSRSIGKFAAFFQPQFALVPELAGHAWVTILLAILATPAAVVASIPVGIAAAANLSPRWIRVPVRCLLALERAMPEIVIAFLLVAAYGLGIFPAVVALWVCSVSMIGKMLGDTIEQVEPQVIESIAMTGATPLQVMTHCILPQIAPALISYSLFRFEINVRASAILGAIAGQGIGYELMRSINLIELPRASTAILVLALLILLTEKLCSWARRRLHAEGKLR